MSQRLGCFLLATVWMGFAGHAAEPSNKVFVFYYPWYATPAHDGGWQHWNHAILPQSGPITFHYTPPDDIGSTFYPQLGPYSSKDATVIATHLDQIAGAGVGIVNLSWWGRSGSMNFIDESCELVIAAAEAKGLKINFMIEPYPGRGAASVRQDLVYLIGKYGNSPALYRDPERGNRPMITLYDSYLVPAAEWATILDPSAEQTIRGTEIDALVIALYVNENDYALIHNGHFDGCFTYFATKGFTQGSDPFYWGTLRRWTRQVGKMFIPSVGPGYDDLRIRPWNTQNLRDRQGGKYYDDFWRRAIAAEPDMISISTFNEWHEGTQIEPAVPTLNSSHTYPDYSPEAPDFYLRRTEYWVGRYRNSLADPAEVKNADVYE